MIDDLLYWVEWIQNKYKYLLSKDQLEIKPYYFNRIRYEITKALSMEMEDHNDLGIYKSYLDVLKPYNINKILPGPLTGLIE